MYCPRLGVGVGVDSTFIISPLFSDKCWTYVAQIFMAPPLGYRAARTSGRFDVTSRDIDRCRWKQTATWKYRIGRFSAFYRHFLPSIGEILTSAVSKTFSCLFLWRFQSKMAVKVTPKWLVLVLSPIREVVTVQSVTLHPVMSGSRWQWPKPTFTIRYTVYKR